MPRPAFEIWVHSPQVEGVHLRFGAVARGGLRWSDRRDDFRTEVLGLVKAQMVKNAVIVPTGSKGGFFGKQLPDPSVDREAWMEAGRSAYRAFISGLLDVTDNVETATGAVVPPAQVVRRDGDDWVITGRKMFITNGSQADWICLLARTSDEGGYRGMSQIILPTKSEGFSVSRLLDKMGNRSSDTAELVLDEATVDHRIAVAAG